MTDVLEIYREIQDQLIAPGGPFEILDQENPRTRAFAGTKSNYNDIFAEAGSKFAHNLAYEYEGERRTWGEVVHDAERLADSLVRTYAIAPGDRIGLAMHNCPDWLVGFIATLRLGGVATLLNSRGAPEELRETATRVGCRIVLADARCTERLAPLADLPVIGPERQRELVAAGTPGREIVRGGPDAPAMILFTSGTTGKPKGATLTHRNLCAMARTMEYMAAHGLHSAARRMGMDPAKLAAAGGPLSVFMIMPVFHISGIVNLTNAAISGGIMSMLPRWDPAKAIDLIERNKVANLAGPTLVITDLLAQPGAIERMQSVRAFSVGGQATPVALTHRIKALFPAAGQGSGWGMTEACGMVASATGPVFLAHPGTVGFVLPVMEAEIRDAARNQVPQGEPGEIWVRGPLVMQGYWGDPAATAAVFDGDWYSTGDLGLYNADGLLVIVDRTKDMVISAGENIYCAEVERVLSMHEHHVEVALFGVPDERLGERAVAAIVLAEGIAGDPGAVAAFVRQHLADYKVPTEILFMESLPRTALGKIDKVALRQMYQTNAPAPAA